MIMSWSAIPVAIVLLFSPPLRQAAVKSQLRQKTREVQKALVDGNLDKYLSFFYPGILEHAPREVLLPKMSATYAKNKAKMKLYTAGDVGDPSGIHSRGKFLFAFVPYKLRVELKKVTVTLFVLWLSSDHGKNWTMADGMLLKLARTEADRKMVLSWLPPLPLDMKLPEIVVDRDKSGSAK